MGVYGVNHMKFLTEILIRSKGNEYPPRREVLQACIVFLIFYDVGLYFFLYSTETHTKCTDTNTDTQTNVKRRQNYSNHTFNLFPRKYGLAGGPWGSCGHLSPTALTSGSMQNFLGPLQTDVCLQYEHCFGSTKMYPAYLYHPFIHPFIN